MIKEYIAYIKKRMKSHNTTHVIIHTGKLPKALEKGLKEHFKVTKEFFGFTRFDLKEDG